LKRCLVIILLTLSTACAPEYSGKTQPPIVDGTIDLSDWDFEKDGIISLNTDVMLSEVDGLKQMPCYGVTREWGMAAEAVGGVVVKPTRLALKVSQVENRSISFASSAHQRSVKTRVLATNCTELFSGDIGTPTYVEYTVDSKVTQDLGDTPSVLYFYFDVRSPWEGRYFDFLIGESGQLQREASRLLYSESVIVIFYMALAVFHVILFMLNRTNTATLAFASLCIIFSIRSFISGPIDHLQPSELGSWTLWVRQVEWATMPLAVFGFYHYLQLLLRIHVPKALAISITVACFGLTVAPAFLNHVTLWSALPIYQAFALFLLCGMLVKIGFLAVSGDRVARWVLLSAAICFVAAIHDVLVVNGLMPQNFGIVPILPYALLLFVLIQGGLLSAKNAAAYRRAERLGMHLKEEVKLQTIELQEQTDAAMRAKEEANSLRQSAEEDAEKLRELDQQKTAFFQNMSHELRTPLTLILGPLEESTKRHTNDGDIAVATKNARRLLRLVNQLLDFQKLEAGKKDLNLAPLNLNRFTHVLGDYFASACSSKAIEFNVTRDGRKLIRDEVFAIQSEPDALEKVAFNFLSNALKYTPQGGTIELGLQSQPENRVRLFVKDSGPGISEEGQTKLFQVFSQVEESTTREYEGTGLGLALVKSLVEEMGGTVGVESEVGQGSTFFAEFPVIEADAIEQEDFKARAWLLADGGETGVETEVEEEGDVGLESEGKGQLVLVVDDLEDMRNLIGNALKKRGYRVLKAANGEQGYEVICDRRPDLVISDWMMPKLSGPDMLKQVRANNDISTTPFILLTAKSDEESKLIGTEIGADVFLGKPFNDQELGSAVRNLLGLKSREKEVQKLNDYITESVLKRYLPPALIGDILSGELSMDKPAELRDITVLFSDLKGFTKTSEDLGPEGISAFLNEYLTVMNEVIFEHGGTIDKFIGDAIMVLFGAPQDMDPEEQVKRATDCAKAMQRAMEGITRMWKADGAGDLQMRIGIHHGSAVVGNFGSTQRSDYTAIGPCVNMAARIESASEPGEVFVSDATAKLMGEEATAEVGAFELKGIEGKATLYRVV